MITFREIKPVYSFLAILVVIIAIFGYVYIESNSNIKFGKRIHSHPGTTQSQLKSEISSGILNYTIVKTKDISYAGTPRMVYRVVLDVEDFPLEVEIKRIARRIWENGNKHWKEFTVFMYLPSMDSNGAAFVVAEFRPDGLKEFKVQMFALSRTKWEKIAEQKDKLLSEVASKKRKEIEKETGPIQITTEIKKKIYSEYLNDSLWASDDGTDRVPLQLNEKYIKKYNLSRLELAAILTEGAEKGW